MTGEDGHVPGRRRFGWYRPKPQSGMDLHIMARPLDEEHWREFRQYTRVIEKVRPFIIDYLALSADYRAAVGVGAEIAGTLSLILQEGMISIPAGVDANARAQQLVTNYLGAASAFRDRAASRISRDYGSDSPQAKALKATMSSAYDASFAYRAMYALRNYAQHNELPISYVPINAERAPGGAMVAEVALHLSPSTLAVSHRLNAKLRAELRARADEILELTPLMIEFMLAHQAIMYHILELYYDKLGAMAHYAAALYRTFEVPHDVVPVVWEGDDPKDGPHTQTACFMIGVDEMVRALELRDQLKLLLGPTMFSDLPVPAADF
jgi:hypothetical protein